MNYSRRQSGNRRQSSRSRRSRNLEEPVNLMQLMRRRSRYRPYSVNNRNMRRVQHPYNAVNDALPGSNDRNSRSNQRRNVNHFNLAIMQDVTSPFNAFDSANRQDMGTNTEIPCCARHSLTEHATHDENVHEFDIPYMEEMALEDNRSLIYEDLAELDNNSINSCEGLPSNEDCMQKTSVANFESPKVTENTAQLNATKSNESKSQEDSNTDTSGSSGSFVERDESPRKLNLSDITTIGVNNPQVMPHFESFDDALDNSFNLIAAAHSEENTNESFYVQHLRSTEVDNGSSYEDIEAYIFTDIASSESLLREDIVGNSQEQTAPSNENVKLRDDISETFKSPSENIKIKDNTVPDNNETHESSSHDKTNPERDSVAEVLESSSDVEEEVPTTARFAFIEVHSNTSTENNASDLNNDEGEGFNTATADCKAAGDGHHNDDSVIQIEFTICTNIHHDNEDTNADDEGSEDSEEGNEAT